MELLITQDKNVAELWTSPVCVSGKYKWTPPFSSITKLGHLYHPESSSQFKHFSLKLSPGRVQECVCSTKLNCSAQSAWLRD